MNLKFCFGLIMFIFAKSVASFHIISGSYKPNNIIRKVNKMTASSKNVDSSHYKVGFMFPGQGAQTVGMSGAVCAKNSAAKNLFDTASQILGYDLLSKCVSGPKAELDSTVISQPAIFVSSMAALEMLKVENPAGYQSATVAMGLSLGEYSALCFAGAFSFEDGVRLVKARGEAMQEASEAQSSGMVAIIGLDIAGVDRICAAVREKTGQSIRIANYLSDGNYAISGGMDACKYAQEIAKSMGAKMAMPLAVAGAFHTDYMKPAVPKLKTALDKVQFSRPRIPVFSNVDAICSFDETRLKQNLESQVTSPVQWETTMKTLLASPDLTNLYEIGPGTVCKGIVKRMNKKMEVISVTV